MKTHDEATLAIIESHKNAAEAHQEAAKAHLEAMNYHAGGQELEANESAKVAYDSSAYCDSAKEEISASLK